MRPSVAVALLALLSAGALSGCATQRGITSQGLGPASLPAPLAISRAAVEPKTLDARVGGVAVIRYALSHPAQVELDLVDGAGRVVRQLHAGPQGAGRHTLQWAGDTAEGRPAPRGVYRYIIRAQDAQGRQAMYDPSREIGGEALEPRDFVFDRQAGRFNWIMPKAGCARLRVSVGKFPHLRTLLDWEPLEGGAHALVWDGRDASGLMTLTEHPDLSVRLVAFALAPNTIIVRGEPQELPTRQPIRGRQREGFSHAHHPRADCHEVRFRVEVPGATHDAQGRAQLSGRVPVRVWLDERDAVRLVNERFDIMLFVDLTIIVEEGEGSNPYTYLWDTTGIPPGPHLLTVNVLGYADHFGVVTQPVLIGSAG